MKKIRIALVDDHKLFRNGLFAILSQVADFQVVFEATNGREFLNHPQINEIDVVLLDIKMPELDGIATTKILREKNQDLKVIILSMHDEDQFIMHLMEIGANGYLLKDSDIDEVITAIKKVNDSGIYFSDIVSRVMLKKMAKGPKSSPRFFNYKTDISDREIEVLKHICDGKTASEIAEHLFISPRTVDGHRLRIMEKLGVNNTAKLVAFAIKNNIITDF
jgi:two-component system, NarL family, response regulator DegU